MGSMGYFCRISLIELNKQTTHNSFLLQFMLLLRITKFSTWSVTPKTLTSHLVCLVFSQSSLVLISHYHLGKYFPRLGLTNLSGQSQALAADLKGRYDNDANTMQSTDLMATSHPMDVLGTFVCPIFKIRLEEESFEKISSRFPRPSLTPWPTSRRRHRLLRISSFHWVPGPPPGRNVWGV